MTCDAQTLNSTIRSFAGGSDNRYRHHLNRKLIYTEGMRTVAETAGSYWLIDDIALLAAPKYAKAWMAGQTGIGIVKLIVTDGRFRLTLGLSDDQAPEVIQEASFTTFPDGEWTFYLETGSDDDGYYTTLLLPPEH